MSETGQKQAQALAKALVGISIDQIYSSPLKRTMQTATLISQGLLCQDPIPDQRLKEINHGEWEGKTKEQIKQEYPDQLHFWKTEPETVTFPQGEKLDQVLQRSFEFLDLITKYSHQRVAIVTHDTVIRSLLTKFLLRELKDIWLYQLDAGGYSVIEWNGKFKQVIKINANEHLKDIASDLSIHAL